MSLLTYLYSGCLKTIIIWLILKRSESNSQNHSWTKALVTEEGPSFRSQQRIFGNYFQIIIHHISDLFHPDNIKNKHSKQREISISLYNFWHVFGGPRGLAQRLDTSVKVRQTQIIFKFRMELKQHLAISRLEEKRKDIVVNINSNSFGTNT